MIAKDNIERHSKNLQIGKPTLTILDHLNFWSNFGLNFKDDSFVEIFLKDKDVLQKLFEVLEKIESYLINFISSSSVSRNEFILDSKSNEYLANIEIALKFFDLHTNITCNNKIVFLLKKNQKKSFERIFSNFNKIFKMDFNAYRNSLYEVIGLSYLDNKGNFIFADNQTEYFFHCSNLEKKNFFQILTQFSKFNIRHKFGENFYDFKKPNCRIREFIFTIDLNLTKFVGENLNSEYTKEHIVSDNIDEKIFIYWNKCKTLLGRISTVLLPIGTEFKNQTQSNHPTACILLETKLSKFRENFDDLVWKEIYY